MKRYKEKVFGSIQQSSDGIFVLHTEVLEMMSSYLQFAIDHEAEIKNDVEGFGVFKSLLAMVKGK